MSKQLRRQLPNRVTFPRQLRDAIPDWELCNGRVLQLDSADAGITTHDGWAGPRVAIKLTVCETGKLSGVFDVRVDLNISAARGLAELIQSAVERVEKQQAGGEL